MCAEDSKIGAFLQPAQGFTAQGLHPVNAEQSGSAGVAHGGAQGHKILQGACFSVRRSDGYQSSFGQGRLLSLQIKAPNAVYPQQG
jgi:hypothetical protein